MPSPDPLERSFPVIAALPTPFLGDGGVDHATHDVLTFFVELRQQLPDVKIYGNFFAERTGVQLDVSDISAIVSAAGLDGIKISGDVWQDLPALRSVAGPVLPILTGYDSDAFTVQRLGASGLISGLSCVEPHLYREFADAIGDRDQVLAQISSLGARAGGSISDLKAALSAAVPGSWALRIPHH